MNPAIYVVTNSATGEQYVGSSGNLPHRWTMHKSSLRGGRHHSRTMQAAWDKYGEWVFSIAVIEYCTPARRDVREQFWIRKLKPAYNKALTLDGCGILLSFPGYPETWKEIERYAKGLGMPVADAIRHGIRSSLEQLGYLKPQTA